MIGSSLEGGQPKDGEPEVCSWMNLKRTHKHRNLHLRCKLTLFFLIIIIGAWEHIRIGEGSLQGTDWVSLLFTPGSSWASHTHTHTHTLVFFLGPTKTTFGMHCSFHLLSHFEENVHHLLWVLLVCTWYHQHYQHMWQLMTLQKVNKICLLKVICKVTLSSPSLSPAMLYPTLFDRYPQSKEMLLNLSMKFWNSTFNA
jgi:hypothetical protein